MKTELCQLAQKWTTDKALYYTEFYHSLLKNKRDAKKVLEMGIGYPCDYMRYSMNQMDCKEYKTGASIYMWQEYFPEAQIYALDNIREILINEGRIKSFYCDQADESTYPLNELGIDFDLIVEDGLHIKEYQIKAADVLVSLLAPGGIYIMEDIGYLTPLERRELQGELCFDSELKEFGDKLEAAVIVIRRSDERT